MKLNKKAPHNPFWSTSSSLKKLCQNYFLTNLHLCVVSVSSNSMIQDTGYRNAMTLTSAGPLLCVWVTLTVDDAWQ